VAEELGEALEHIGVRLERGLQEAERELSEVRGRCSALEAEIRSIRAALEAAPDPDPQRPTVEAAGGRETPVAPSTEPDRIDGVEVRDEEGEIVVTVPSATPETDAPEEDGAGEPPADDLPPSSYMPMLEELWEIARRADD
jgi:PAS domain-containing protein